MCVRACSVYCVNWNSINFSDKSNSNNKITEPPLLGIVKYLFFKWLYSCNGMCFSLHFSVIFVYFTFSSVLLSVLDPFFRKFERNSERRRERKEKARKRCEFLVFLSPFSSFFCFFPWFPFYALSLSLSLGLSSVLLDCLLLICLCLQDLIPCFAILALHFILLFVALSLRF